ncbi:hypothetical protein BKA82DRAFT_4079877, partial [Pisolithus tinctorius]
DALHVYAINIIGDLPDRPSSSRVICIFVGRPTLEVSSLYLACCYAVSLAFRGPLLVRFPFFCILRGVPYDLPVFFVDPPSRCRSGDSPAPTFEDLRSYLTRFSAVPLAFLDVSSPRFALPGDTFFIRFRAATVDICLFLYSGVVRQLWV